jgi:putative hydrolase of the HAD superfamily
MPRRARAILFDLDDTLYPVRRFRQSGFAAVAAHLERTQGIDRARSMDILERALDGPDRGQEFQRLIEAWHLPDALLGEFVEVLRSHEPEISLPAVSARVLTALRPVWKLGIVTNGPAAIQGRKVQALNVAPLVDAVIYAAEHGSGAGKPEPAPFREAARLLDIDPKRVVFVGDSEECDIEGAKRVGMRTVRITAWAPSTGPTNADAVIHSLSQLPRVAAGLLERGTTHAA